MPLVRPLPMHALPHPLGVYQRALLSFVAVSLFCMSGPSSAICQEATSDQRLQFFETKIRPVLVEHCYSCHSEEAEQTNQLRGGLWLDSREGLIEGGDSGPSVIPGDPEASPLLAAIRYESFEMPPEGPLPEHTVQDFEQWIREGAVDPRERGESPAVAKSIDWDSAKQHWSYQPLRNLDGGTIDTWLSAGNPPHSFEPSPPASPETLLRRLSIDLTGLPPSPEQLTAFAEDNSPQAYSRMVDSLLASPEFGIRWGRHWLDLARFAESVTLRGLVQHNAWRYRDYVIDQLNADTPYNRFLTEQIAGDLLPYESIEQAQRQHIATTFLTLGNLNLEDQDKEKLRMDAVDEQLTVLGSAILAQTLGCARCHDHKFDPIPTRDYYALAGIFYNTRILEHSNVSSWIDRPLPVDPTEAERLKQHELRANELRTQISQLKKQLTPDTKLSKEVPAVSLTGLVFDNDQAILTGAWTTSQHTPHFVGTEYLHDDAAEFGTKSAQFSFMVPENGDYEVRVSYSAGDNRNRRTHIAIQDFLDTHSRTIDQRNKPPIDDLFVSLGIFRFVTTMPGSVTISNADGNGHTIVDSVQLIPITPGITEVTPSRKATGDTTLSTQKREQLQNELKIAQQQLDRWMAQAPEKPLYMGAYEEKDIVDLAVQIRGNVHHHGQVAPRGFLQIIPTSETPLIPKDQSGRIELASWLTSRENPLTARVLANRIWFWLCGEGIVRSVDNFGITGQPPTHPELLDYLALRLIQSDWSIKSVVREIVHSDTYKRSSTATESLAKHDPENRLWLRANSKPLAAEPMLDLILSFSGQLDRQMGGKTLPDRLAADYDFDPTTNRRAIYWPLLRNALPEMMLVFDGANPSMVTGQRWHSTVAPQALFLMNDPWVLEHCRDAAKQILAIPDLKETERVTHLYQSLLGRVPSDAEANSMLTYLKSRRASPEVVWSEMIQSLMATVDFRYVD